jgi:hypothetical protein
VLFNVFLNDIFNFVKENKLYNYADDNTLSQSGTDLNGSAKSLEKESAMLIDCFPNNKMKANPDKFQAIAIGNKYKNEDMKFDFDGNEILCENEVKLLGVTIDCQLKINTHISEICLIKKSFKAVRDRPFNLQGEGGLWVFFRSENFFRSEKIFRTTREIAYLFILSRKARIFFPEFNNMTI